MTQLLCVSVVCAGSEQGPKRAADGLMLCWRCTGGIERNAKRAAVLHDELALVLTATGGPGGGGSSFAGGTQLNLAAGRARGIIRSVLTDLALRVAMERGVRLPGHWRRVLQPLPEGVVGPLNQVRAWMSNTNKHALADFVAAHHMWLAANYPQAADKLDEACYEGYRAAYPAGTRTIDIGQCPEEDEDGVQCWGLIRALIRDEDSLLPKACVCNLSDDHIWTADQWHALGRRLRAKPKPLNRLTSTAFGHGGWAERKIGR